MLQNLLLSLDIFVCAALVAVVLMQRSEGGALGTSSGPTGLITTRGVGDLLTRTTWGLAIAFALLSLALTIVEGRDRSNEAILNRLRLQNINPDAVQTHPAAPAAAPGAPPAPISGPAPLNLPAPQAAPLAAPVPATQRPVAAAPATTRPAAAHTTAAAKPASAPAAAPAAAAPAPAPAAAAEAPPPVITPPPRVSPQSAPSATPAPKSDSDAPVAHHEP